MQWNLRVFSMLGSCGTMLGAAGKGWRSADLGQEFQSQIATRTRQVMYMPELVWEEYGNASATANQRSDAHGTGVGAWMLKRMWSQCVQMC